ncbi:MAG: DUF1987 domain-containing protein [Bacteroidota bacterium]
MLKILEIKEKEDAPYVFMDADEGFVEIKGKSYPPDVGSFYEPILEWLDTYKDEATGELNINLKMEYFNTASSKLLLDILYKLEEIDELGKKVAVNWYYPEDDDEMLDLGEEYEGLVELDFRHISYEQKY